MQPPTERFIV